MDDAVLLPRAFLVESLPDDFDPSLPPSTGQEYLQHVMFESSTCPQVVVANVDRMKFKTVVNSNINNNVKPNEGSKLAPSLEWQNHQVAKFSELRHRISRLRKSKHFQPITLPKGNDEEKWYEIFFGDKKVKMLPHLTFVLSMSEPLLEKILEYHAEWLEDGLKPDQGRWIYAILSCLSFPLTSNMYSVLRDVARNCAKLRCTKTSPENHEVVVLNLIICLVSKYFGQVDLAD